MAEMQAAALVMALMLNGANGDFSIPNVSCLIINLEYINCMWVEQGIPEFNYTFHSRHSQREAYRECPVYLVRDGRAVGCRLLYEKGIKFRRLRTRLTTNSSSSERQQEIDLQDLVKLDPPQGLYLELEEGTHNSLLWLHWRPSCPSACVESQVRYRHIRGLRGDDQWKVTLPIMGYSFTPPFFSPGELFEFQVRMRVPDSCSQSKYWSDWSTPVAWLPTQHPNRAGFHPLKPWSTVYWLVLAVLSILIG
ncbi:hypothetical protein AGOR_G00069840 [Albula goreensis]|uniref:Fibronectin type-III domain-containing protein n=1 Tax=Albula goreensis TaxID=1534307 RepID=A0A8T3DQT4_9TELE|nr:hypothetical protein AGOR_G00069840 [Albula goreensis]